MSAGGWLADRLATDEPEGPVPRARAWRCSASIPFVAGGDLQHERAVDLRGDLPRRDADVHQHRPVQRGHRQRGRCRTCGRRRTRSTLFAVHFLGDIWSPTADGLGGRLLRPRRLDGQRLRPGARPPSAPCRRPGPASDPENLDRRHARRRPGAAALGNRPPRRRAAPARARWR